MVKLLRVPRADKETPAKTFQVPTMPASPPAPFALPQPLLLDELDPLLRQQDVLALLTVSRSMTCSPKVDPAIM